MKKVKLRYGASFREFPAKPALLKRCDVSRQQFDVSMATLGFGLSPEEMLKLPPPGITSLEVFRREYWAAEMWSKFPFEVGVDREQVAISAFVSSEEGCAETNKRLADGWSRPWPESTRLALKQARRAICTLLDGLSLEEVFTAVDWGPGASSSFRRSRASKPIKWDAATHCTPDCEPYVYSFKSWSNRDLGQQTRYVNGNKVTTVPKNAKTDRVIAIEPDWNMFFQKGVGRCIRRRLNKVGLLLEDQRVNSQARNRALARFGSESNTFGTIDLRGASDSISLALCELLLPDWFFRLIFDLRSHIGKLPSGESVIYEKISSMGNGYTFELETLIFWALSKAIDGVGAVVYGDDIIVANREIGLRLIDLLRFVGFEVNPKKTFLDGPFRESCGGHYFNGVDVTPPYVRKPLASLPAMISYGNALNRANMLDYLDPLFLDLRREVGKTVPRQFRGPTSAGDVCLHSSFDACTPVWVPDWQCFAGLGLSGRVGTERSPERGGFLSALHGASQGSNWVSDHKDYYVVSQWSSYPWTDG
jgi:hypothetical protein